ncbi:hypothetical protein COV18_03230 [Candidatus Woesearchaeota archaeon CG10_big_fil_rev_8_21_14_0_10_37_12]|nr:MAG: hypothetical protein COV18_03230 [Candidatus Woesearchaeota archaeon CG10_big_fil_rev_8_21_14_0_10_37_12]
MNDVYLSRAKEALGTHKVRVVEASFGYLVIKGNDRELDGANLLGFELDLTGRVLHERVAILERGVGIRSHEETSAEVVKNVGDTDLQIVFPHDKQLIRPGELRYSVAPSGSDLGRGFYHGFDITDGPGLLYVAKALHPEFVEGDSFRVPDNSYKQ